MDPTLLPSVMHSLIPILGMLTFFGCPIGILWVIKHHQFRMRELEIEAGRLSPGVEQRLGALEARLAAIEKALAPASALQERAALLEGPPDAARVRDR